MVSQRRTRKDWALFINGMLDEHYPAAVKVILAMDNLNTHSTASKTGQLAIIEREATVCLARGPTPCFRPLRQVSPPTP